MAKKLEPVPGRTVLVTKRGATANGTQVAVTSVTVHSGALRFANGDRICLHDDETVFVTVDGTPTSDTSLPVTPAISVTDGDRIVNLGADGGASEPRYDGADSKVTIYSEPTTSGDAIADNKVTTDADGEYAFYAAPGIYDIHILDSSGNLSANSQTLADVPIGFTGRSAYRFIEATSGTSQEDEINAAIVEIDGLGGGVVELGAGTFTIDAVVTLADNVWLRGAGAGKTIIKTKDSTAITSMGYAGTTKISDVHLSDFTIDGNDLNQTTGSATGISMKNTDRLLIERVEVKNMRGNGISVGADNTNVDIVTVRDSIFRNCGTRAAGGSDLAIIVSAADTFTIRSVIIADNHIREMGKDSNGTTNYSATTNKAGAGIKVSATGNADLVNVTGNHFYDIQTTPISISDDAGTEIDSVTVSGNTMHLVGQVNQSDGGQGIFLSVGGNVVVDGNSVDTVAASSDDGIELSGQSGNCVVSNNRVTGVANSAKAGITVLSFNKVAITGNVVHDCSGVGISSIPQTAGKSSITVSGNVVDTCSGIGLSVGARDEVSLVGNTVKASGGNGISFGVGSPAVEGVENAVISGNVVAGSTGDAIYCVMTGAMEGNGISITGNVCQGSGNRGIAVGSINHYLISGNTVIDNDECGIEIGNCDDGLVANNFIRNNGVAPASIDDGIYISASATVTDLLIDGNVITDHANTGALGINLGGGVTLTNVGVTSSNVFEANQAGDMHGSFSARASASPLVIPWGQNMVTVTGTTGFTTITATHAGHIVTLKFDSGLTVSTGGNIKLAGAANFVATADDTLTLACDGTNWFEIGRSNNA